MNVTLWLSLLGLLFLAILPSGAQASGLLDASERGDHAAVRQLLAGGASVAAARGDGMTALHLAADRGHADVVAALLAAGASPSAGTRIGSYTPLHVAARKGHGRVVELLLAKGADASARVTTTGVLPLHLAAASGDQASIRALIRAGANVNARAGQWGQTALMFAAAANRVDALELLLQLGADPSLTSRSVDPAEKEQADQFAEQALKKVLERMKAEDGGGPTWLPSPRQVQAAIRASREVQLNWSDIVRAACAEKAGASPQPGAAQEARTTLGELPPPESLPCGRSADDPPRPLTYGQLVGGWGGLTALLHATRQGHRDAVAVLLKNGANIDQRSTGDATSPLLMAIVNGHFDLAMDLLSRGANPNLISDAGTGPLFATLERQWAPWANYAHPAEVAKQETSHLELLAALLEAGADPNVRLRRHLWYSEFLITVMPSAGLHYDGATPFWRATQALDLEAMRLLRDHGALVDVPTIKPPERRRRGRGANAREAKDHSGLPPVPVGGPFLYPVHLAAGAGYGQGFVSNAHRHVPGNWMPVLRFLVEECQADIDRRDANGYTALHHAAARGDNEMIQYLVARGADVKVVSRSGQTTADMANGPIQRLPPFLSTIELLVGLGAVNNDRCVSC